MAFYIAALIFVVALFGLVIFYIGFTASRDKPGGQGMQVRQLGRTGNDFVDECFECNWVEFKEPRTWYDDPELKLVADLANDEKYDQAMVQLTKLWKRFSDHDFVYGWKADILARQGDKPAAIETLKEGLKKCRKKYTLCYTRAQIEFRAGDINNAVIWWIRSVASQIAAGDLALESPLLYLAYVADAFGDDKSKSQLLQVVDRLTRLGCLNNSASSRINLLVSRHGDRSMCSAVQLLCQHYL